MDDNEVFDHEIIVPMVTVS